LNYILNPYFCFLDPAPEKLAFKTPGQLSKEAEIEKNEEMLFSTIKKPIGLLKEGTDDFVFFSQREDVRIEPRVENQIERRENEFKPWQMRKYVR
jgi:hypothetical protein